MLSPVRIRNFKSIRTLDFEARRVNVFVGEPNTGKSNVIEALTLLCPEAYPALNELLRFRITADLFFDQKTERPIAVAAGEWRVVMSYLTATDKYQASMVRDDPATRVQKWEEDSLEPGGPFTVDSLRATVEFDSEKLTAYKSHGEPIALNAMGVSESPIRYYRFRASGGIAEKGAGVLRVPDGSNLFGVVYGNATLRRQIGELFKGQGFRLQLRPASSELCLAKDVNDEIYSYPWSGVSETLRRVSFLMALLETNRGSAILLDEPEAHTFPFYTKLIAERIALDDSNQFFLTTHNPCVLSSVVEKTKPDDLAVFVTRMDHGETRLLPIPTGRLPELLELDSDAFFNLERLVEA